MYEHAPLLTLESGPAGCTAAAARANLANERPYRLTGRGSYTSAAVVIATGAADMYLSMTSEDKYKRPFFMAEISHV